MGESSEAAGAFRAELERLQQAWAAEDQHDKISNRSTLRLEALYAGTEGSKRAVFDTLLCEWVESEDSGKCFDANAIIRAFQVRSCLASVRRAHEHWTLRLAGLNSRRGWLESRRAAFDRGDAMFRVDSLARTLSVLATARPHE